MTISILSINNNISFGYEPIFIATIFSIIGAILPDIIEPAKSPSHRSFFHSFTMLIIAGLFSYHLLTGTESANMSMIGFLGIGYVSHLVLDSTTPKSLPLYK
ncbi:metal-dependent hydrolase [Methanohalophilus sp.]